MLTRGPKDYWYILLILLLTGYLYFSIIIILPLFLSQEFGFSDTKAGFFYGGMGASITVWGIIAGTSVDRLGVRLSEIIASITLGIGVVLLAVSFELVLLCICVFIFIPIGAAFSLPVTKIATRRYTLAETRSTAFSLVFMMMNVAAVLGFAMDDVFTHTTNNATFTSFRQIFVISGALMIISLLISMRLREMDYEASGE